MLSVWNLLRTHKRKGRYSFKKQKNAIQYITIIIWNKVVSHFYIQLDIIIIYSSNRVNTGKYDVIYINHNLMIIKKQTWILIKITMLFKISIHVGIYNFMSISHKTLPNYTSTSFYNKRGHPVSKTWTYDVVITYTYGCWLIQYMAKLYQHYFK